MGTWKSEAVMAAGLSAESAIRARGDGLMRLITTLALLFGPVASLAATPPTCSAPEHRQFDFWIGDWRVQKPDGGFAGMNRITQEYGGCVIHEHYLTGKGYSGESLNIYDAARKVWHQTWVDSGGLLLTLEGGWDGRSMVMQGTAPGP